jgi:sigma-E factor negative regulatory protein RseA
MVMDKISALMDGELHEHEARGQLSRLKDDPELAHTWHTFHLIGDAMRGERTLSGNFGRRVTDRMAQEPTVLAPKRLGMPRRYATYALSAAASVSAVAVVGWIALSQTLAPGTPANPQIAQAPAASTETVPSTLASVSSEGKMNEYLIAHQEFSPSTAIQGLAPYIRSVSTTQASQGR